MTRPVITPLGKHISPAGAFESIKGTPNSSLLESASHICALGWFSDGPDYYSVLGYKPFLVFKSKKNRLELTRGDKKNILSGNPFAVLKELLKECSNPGSGIPSPFYCGAVGYFGYDLRHFIEKLNNAPEDNPSAPDCVLCFYDPLVIYDHRKKQLFISSVGINPRAKELTKELSSIFAHPGQEKTGRGANPAKRVSFRSNFSKRDYLDAVKKAKAYIAAGDIFQVNLSQRFSAEYSGDAFALYNKLKNISPAPFMSYLDLGSSRIVGSSPERFLKLSGRAVETRPMKGTRPRGSCPAQDLLLRKELLGSPKDKAELVMIVDLLRNDLGKVCLYNSVKVKALREIEEHPTVFQTTATVTGTLVKNRDRIDLLKACFPGGSITGCPKVRSMEIIDELEPVTRGIYTGALGMLAFNGDMDLSVVIRTIALNPGGRAFFQAGGGIVADSDPEAEYEETLNKARAMMLSLNLI